MDNFQNFQCHISWTFTVWVVPNIQTTGITKRQSNKTLNSLNFYYVHFKLKCKPKHNNIILTSLFIFTRVILNKNKYLELIHYSGSPINSLTVQGYCGDFNICLQIFWHSSLQKVDSHFFLHELGQNLWLASNE